MLALEPIKTESRGLYEELGWSRLQTKYLKNVYFFIKL